MAKAIHANVKIALTAVNAAEHKYPDVQPDGRMFGIASRTIAALHTEAFKA